MRDKGIHPGKIVSVQNQIDNALDASEGRYRILVENTSAIIYTLTTDGVFTFVSQAWTDFLGSPANQVVGKRIGEFIHPDDLAYCQASLEMVVSTGGQTKTSIEYRVRHTDGSWRWHRSRGIPVKNKAGVVVSYQGIASDITDEKMANEAVHESLYRWQTTFDAIPDIVCVISKKHTFLEINMAGVKALHLPREEIIGRKCYELVHGTKKALLVCPCTRTLETGEEGFSEYKQDGRIYSLIAWPQKDASGNVVSFVHIVKDITERKQAEDALKESEQNFRTLADSGQALVWAAGIDTLCNYFNRVWLEFTGSTIEQELGNGWEEGVHPDDLQRSLDIYAGAFEKRSSFSMEYRLRHYDGEYRWILDDGCPRYDAAGTFIGYIGHCLDITDRKKVEDELHVLNANLEQRVQLRTAELLAANKELEAFSYSVSHDLRAPLRSIEGFSKIFIDEYGATIPEKGCEYLERVRRNVLLMGQLIDSMLDLSRLTRNEIHLKKTDVSALATRIAEDLAVENPNHNVQVDIEPGMTALVDPQLLRIVLTNLLDNAWKFTSKHEHAQVRVGTVRDLRHGTAFFVRDDGVGFNNEYEDKLFSAFQRLHSNKDYPGTGIGLATIARIVHRHGGEVWAESEVDKGATFYFSIPNLHAAIPENNEKK